MLPWIDRAPEVKYLFNPAFCAFLIAECVKTYKQEGNRDMVFLLSFLLLPIILHKPTRDLLPQNSRQDFADWIESHPQILSGYAQRVTDFIPYTREALIFGIQKNVISINKSGYLSINHTFDMSNSDWISSSTPVLCGEKSRLIGRWFAQMGTSSAICRLLGIKF